MTDKHYETTVETVRLMEALRFPGPRLWTPQWLRRRLRYVAARRPADGVLRYFFGALDMVWVAEVRRLIRARKEILAVGK